MDLEVTLGMIAGRANLRSPGAHNDVSAVTAFPYLHFAFFKYGGALYVAQ